MKSKLLILLCIIFTQAFGQTPPASYEFITKQKLYNFSDTILLQLSKDTRFQHAAVMLSFINNYKKALQVWDWEHHYKTELNHDDSLYFQQFKPRNAKDFIVERAGKYKLSS